jgi:UDP-2-acetamido-2-deoxy-ribo-hexuluronate aminotransferase
LKRFQEAMKSYVGVRHALGCANGTDAIQIALMALGVQPGDEIIIPAFTYYATAEMPALLGAKPVFVDVDPETFNIDPEKIAEKITEKTKGIIPVSLYGQCADFTRINAVAQEHGLFVIEDGAQAFGSTYRGQKSCSFTTVATTSFFPFQTFRLLR